MGIFNIGGWVLFINVKGRCTLQTSFWVSRIPRHCEAPFIRAARYVPSSHLSNVLSASMKHQPVVQREANGVKLVSSVPA